MENNSTTNFDQQARMIALIKQLAPAEGYTQSLLDDVTLMRSDRPLKTTPALYEPSIVIVVQGRKRGFHGGEVYVYDSQHYLVLSVPLPFNTETEASGAEPMLGVVLRIDPEIVSQLAIELDEVTLQQERTPASLYANRVEPALKNATLRLLEALTSAEEARVIGPLIVREIIYRILIGKQGDQLRAASQLSGHYGRIARVVRYIHSNYAGRLDVATLAEVANMSVPAFHVHFKQFTHSSPNQYVKSIRLHHARLIMIRRGVSAATAADLVGYQSPSQFSREFKRLFGRTPVNEVQEFKELLQLSVPAGYS